MSRGTVSGNGIVTDGLVMALDAANPRSYISGSTIWRDLSVNSYTGSLINGPLYSNSNAGTIYFDGIDDIASFGTTLDFNYDNFTACVWAKSPTNVSGATGFPIHVTNLIGKGNWNAVASWRIGYKSLSGLPAETLSFSYGINWQTPAEISVASFDLSAWNFFVGVATPTKQFLYLNGVEVASVTATKISVVNVEDFQLGRSSYINRFFMGNISNASIYNRALSTQEILQNYNATKPRFGL